MTIQISSSNNSVLYRQRPGDPCALERRLNKHGARWESIGRYPTPELAQAALLEIEAAWRKKAAEE